MNKGVVLSAIATLALGGEALADGMSYTYAQADLLGTRLSIGGPSTDGSGFGFKASAGIGSRMFGFVGIDTTRYPKSTNDLHYRFISLGVGGHMPLGAAMDLIGGVSLERLGLKLSGTGFGWVSGWGAMAGLRGQLGNRFQWTTGIKFRNVDDLNSTFDFSVGGRYYLTTAFALGLDLTPAKHDRFSTTRKESIAALNFRYDFGGG